MGDGRSSGTAFILEEMTTVEHLTELRRRIVISILALAVGTIIGWMLVPRMLEVFANDTGRTFVFVSPGEGFSSHLRLALVSGAFMAAPVMLLQAWYFVLPALFPHEQRLARQYMIPSLLLFVGGIAFGYFAVYPLALIFLLGFGGEQLEPVLSVARFVTFLIQLTLPFGLVFQFPVVLLVLVRLEMVSVQRLISLRKIVYFLSFVVATLLTPPDVASQVLMAIPIIILYELTLWQLRKGDVSAGT